jgi:deazaflavin-dependent oxidoreductase (nitroreductase family)
MSAQERPDNAPGLPNLFPAWIDRLQTRYVNPLLRPAARYLPAFAVVKHRGRKSGTPYETVVNAYRKGDVVAILLGHGKTDWAKNVLAAGGADLLLSGRDVHIINPRILPAGSPAEGVDLPRIARMGGRRMGVFVATVA